MATNLPNPESFEELLGDMLSSYAAKMGINDFNVGSAVTSFFEVVALMVARSSGDLLQILRDFSIDRATGDTLKRLAIENKVTPISANPSTGYVSVIDTNFNKIATKVYAGATPPNIGSTQIKVSDASLFTGTGSVYIGRGTPNVEGPIPYGSIVQVGGYYIVNLNTPTTKFHNVGETVILAQGGNRAIPVNSVVISPSTGATPDIQYQVSQAAVILDGEVQVSNIPVTAVLPGSAGNVPRNGIREFASPPFIGASVTNPLPFTTGADSETDDELRVRIKRALASKGLGTTTAVKASVIGAAPSDEQATVVSSSIVSDSSGATLFIDDGNGYEAKSAGVGLEPIIDSALGGEKFFQLATGGRQAPVAKAFLQSTLAAPFDIKGGDTLSITVGEQTYEHVFANSDFRSPGGATAYEAAASINANTTIGFEATTAGGGQYLVVRAIAETNDSLKTAVPTTNGRDASVLVGFPSNQVETIRLYKNKIPLSKDGATASLFTQSQALWSSTIQNGDTLILSVDGTAAITFTILDADFIAEGSFSSVSPNNSLESWVNVFNSKLTGVTASIAGQQIKLASNLGTSNRAKISIDPNSTLVTKGMFTAQLGLSAQGKAADFTFDRNTAQGELTVALVKGDNLALGSDQTEARLESDQIAAGSVTLAADGHVWILVDDDGAIIPTGVSSSTLLSVSKPSTNVIRFGSLVANAFANVNVGDYLIVWSEQLDASDRFEGRVYAKTNTTLDILVTPAEYAAAATTAGVLYSDGFVVFRSKYAPQKFKLAAGTYTLEQVASALQAQTKGIIFSVLEDQYLVVRSTSKDSAGKIFVVTADTNGKLLSLPVGSSDTSKDSLTAFYNSQFKDADLPLFIHAQVAAGTAADPIDSYITSLSSSVDLSARDPNELVSVLHPYGAVKDAQPYGEHTQVTSYSGTTIGIEQESLIRRLRTVDRFYMANPLDFGSADTVVAVLDNDAESKSFSIPFYRRAITNTTLAVNPSNFNAYDVDSGNTAQFSGAFGANFDFSNFKALMQAKKVLKHQAAQTALLFRSARWGRTGENTTVGYDYPSAANLGVQSVVSVDSQVRIRITLKSGAAIPTSIDASTEWNVTIVSNNPSAGIDQVTYTWNGVGTAPNLTLSGGEYVNIGTNTELSAANTGVFRVSNAPGFAPTSTSFTVQRKTGTAVTESNKSTLVNGQIQFYASWATKASDVAAYVAANMGDYISATIVNDGGLTGDGVIQYSTFEDSGFTYDSVQLKDGINWIASSNLSGSPQFTFKKALALPTDVGYSFNNGEEVRIIPTTMDQVQRFLSVFAVTGFTTVGTVGIVERLSRLSLATDVLGSSGAIQVIGGSANDYNVPVLDSAIRLDNSYMQISASKVAAQGVHSDQWFRLSAANAQSKAALFSSNTSITVTPNFPSVGQSTVKLGGRQINQRYLGRPRHHVRSIGRTFRIEKQGSLVCLSWNGVGTSPSFLKSAVNLNDGSGGTINVAKVSGTSEAEYIIESGSANFSELSIGDLVTVANMFNSANNGTFLVTGVSDDGKTLRVLNANAANEYSYGTYTLNTNASAGDTYTVDGNALVAGTNFAIGATASDTAANLAAVIGTLATTVAQATSNVVKVSANYASANINISYSGTGSTAVSGPTLVGYSFNAGDFSASTEVSEGDTIILSSPFAVLNQGKFRVIRRYNDSVWFENANVIEEEVALPSNNIVTGVDNTTSLKVNASTSDLYINWNGVGTEPDFGSVQVGDIVSLGASFAATNQGDFMVSRAGSKLPEITQLTMPSGAQFGVGGVGKYFLINSAGNVNQYYVWFNVNGGNSDPAPVGLTGIQVAILSGDNATQVAAKAAAVVNVATGLSAVSSDNLLVVTTSGYQETNHASNVSMPAPFAVSILQSGRRTFVEAVNPSASSQAIVVPAAGDFVVNRPQIQFLEYDAVVAGDKFVATGDVIGTANAGEYVVANVIDKDTMVVTGTLAAVTNASMNGKETSAYVLEATPYTGYKRVLVAATQPGSPVRNAITFDTNKQYDKVNEAAGVSLDSLSKLNFVTTVRSGLDSYRYNTGLIAEANRIVYGDPRDSETYPGVGAAGADIFIREPLSRRIQVAIDVRLLTGVPFAQVVEQIRTVVSSLINSNDIGDSIAISDIVAAVNTVRGVRAIAISSPQYDATHDIIVLAPSEKARIIDPVLDISVSQIGS